MTYESSIDCTAEYNRVVDEQAAIEMLDRQIEALEMAWRNRAFPNASPATLAVIKAVCDSLHDLRMDETAPRAHDLDDALDAYARSFLPRSERIA